MPSDIVQLKGITWDHSRGFSSIVAVSQRFHELNPNVEITWSKRSLQAFADQPIDELASQFDFLIIDHPWIGFAARTGVISSLNSLIDEDYLQDQSKNSVGMSHLSYEYNDQQWALAIDAATPVAASRPDLKISMNVTLPKTWGDLVELSKKGLVAIPGIPQDSLMSFYMVCSTLGEHVGQTTNYFISKNTGLKALKLLRELGKNIPEDCYYMNPIQVYEIMSSTDQYYYSPFAYGYSNYAKKDYAKKLLRFHDLVKLNGKRLITTLGGTGLAISSTCKNKEIAGAFVKYAGSAEVQASLYFNSGGQPGHRSAWLDDHTNSVCSNYFIDTLRILDRAFLRPRYHGHMYFQDRAGEPIRHFMMKGGNASDVLNTLQKIYLESLKIE